MKRARNRVEHAVIEAENLDAALRKRNVLGFCLPVSLRALGGNMHLFHVMLQGERMASLSTVHDYGLETGYFIDVFTHMDIDYLESVIDFLSTTRIDETYQEFTGILIHISFEDENSEDNHYIALIPRELLSAKTRKRLEKSKRQLVIDTVGKPTVGAARTTDLLEYFNAMIDHGAGIGFMQIFKANN